MNCLVWFKRDLRVTDHTPLAAAAARGSVLPLYVFEPKYWELPDVSKRQFDFVNESVSDLAENLRDLGIPLVLRVGNVVDVLSDIKSNAPFDQIVSHEETGNSWTFNRDNEVAMWCCANAVRWEEFSQSGVVRRLNGRDGWAAQRKNFMLKEVVQIPSILKGPNLKSDPQPNIKINDSCPQRQIGGRKIGLSILGSFLKSRGQTYRKDMSSPDTGEAVCSRISPYLTYGCLSPREVVQVTSIRQREVRGTRDGWAGSLKSFQARLAWRDHFIQKLEDQPTLEHCCLHSAYEGLRPIEPNSTTLAAWQSGETGIPFVDACMRFLNSTGWLNFRMRSMLMAVASYHLWLDWRVTGLHLAQKFTDFEPGIHWPQVQMQSGTTGMNTVRIYNPIKQGLDQDPTGIFTRRWVPELTAVPNLYLQEPWRWTGANQVLGHSYPMPIVDVALSARAAREKVWALRRGNEFNFEASKIIKKHASRKDSQRYFVRDKNIKSGKKSAKLSQNVRQLGFDF